MTTSNICALVAICVASAHAAAAQPPPRPNDSPRAVTLSLAEYNRLIDLASHPPQTAAAAPVASVLASANLRVRVDRETAHGVFALTGEVLRAGVSRVSLMSGATLIEATVAGRPVPLMAAPAGRTTRVPARI